MKGFTALAISAGLALPVTPAFANEEPCKVVLCMFGELTGQGGGDECKGAIGEYFSIVKTRKKGRFDPSGTAKARMSFLNQCSDNSTGEKERINDKYGAKRGL